LINLKLYDKKLSPYFDAAIAVLAVLFIAVLFVPQSLWSEEDALREECRIRMENLYELEIEFYRLVNRFPESPEEALKIVQMALDSVNADTSFYGAETLRVDTMIYAIDTQGDLAARVDTLMSLTCNGRNFYFSSQSCLSKGDFYLNKDISIIPDKVFMVFDLDKYY